GLFGAVADARTPVTTLVVGEGGSGGALALAAPGNTWATPDSYFSVIAPELAAAILKRAPRETESTADHLRLRPQQLVELGVIRGSVGIAGSPDDVGPLPCRGAPAGRRPPGAPRARTSRWRGRLAAGHAGSGGRRCSAPALHGRTNRDARLLRRPVVSGAEH